MFCDTYYKTRAAIIKAMAHPTRLKIIDTLAEGEMCVGDLQSTVGGDMSTVSKHLTVMKNAGLVVDRKHGLQVFYSLRVPCIMGFFGCIEAVVGMTNPEAPAPVACCANDD